MDRYQSALLSAKGLFLKLQFTRLLGKLARRATESSATVTESSTLDVVAGANGCSLGHLLAIVSILYRGRVSKSTYLHDKSKSNPGNETMNHAVGTAASAVFGVGVSFGAKVLIAVFDLAIDDARAPACDETCEGRIYKHWCSRE
jgi:hypothetical protein